jgi:hypothetical protein
MDDAKEPQKEISDQQDAGRPRELTRRQWLLQLGGTAAVLGFHGAVGETSEASAISTPPADEKTLQALPPGLYEPSLDPMTHALMSDSRFHPIPPGCETDFLTPRSGPYQPQFFTADEFRMVHRLVELMLGKGKSESSPAGSSDDTVEEIAEWIDLVVFNSTAVGEAAQGLSAQHRALAIAYHGPEPLGRLETADGKKTWREGLDWLARESQSGKPLVDLEEAQQIELLRAISDEREDKNVENAGTRLFALLKTQVVQGFYTSKEGLKELDYKGNAFYAECPGCKEPS